MGETLQRIREILNAIEVKDNEKQTDIEALQVIQTEMIELREIRKTIKGIDVKDCEQKTDNMGRLQVIQTEMETLHRIREILNAIEVKDNEKQTDIEALQVIQTEMAEL